MDKIKIEDKAKAKAFLEQPGRVTSICALHHGALLGDRKPQSFNQVEVTIDMGYTGRVTLVTAPKTLDIGDLVTVQIKLGKETSNGN